MLLRSLVARPRLPSAGVTVLAERRRAGRPALDPEERAGVSGTSDSAAGVVRRRLGNAVAGSPPLRCGLQMRWCPPGTPAAPLLRPPRGVELRGVRR